MTKERTQNLEPHPAVTQSAFFPLNESAASGLPTRVAVTSLRMNGDVKAGFPLVQELMVPGGLGSGTGSWVINFLPGTL